MESARVSSVEKDGRRKDVYKRQALNRKERIFCVISYLPKATVQAAIGSVPLAIGLPCGRLVLSVAVLSIIITAPLGALGMDLSYKGMLIKEES